MKYSKLNWNPLIKNIKNELSRSNSPLLIIVPFIKAEPLRELISSVSECNKLKIIVRWLPNDIINRVSDLAVYEITKNRNIPLYVNASIHLKLFVFNNNTAYHTSGNITQMGIGISEKPNIEVGCKVSLGNADWKNLYSIISNSILVNDLIYNAYLEKLGNFLYIKESNVPLIELSNLIPDREFSLDSLPAIRTPQELFQIYNNMINEDKTTELYRRAIHDIILFNIKDDLSELEFFKCLKNEFVSKKFIQRIVKLLEKHKSMRFGGVTNWIQDNCSDVPLPYRVEIKKNTKFLFNWLSYFYEEISWSIPNSHSQVLFWRDQ